jgi:hypothetical protein
MKVVKLNRTHSLFAQGFTYAWRFQTWDVSRCTKIESILRNMHGYCWDIRRAGWTSRFGTWVQHPNHGATKTYWIAVRDPADITAVTLSLDH